MASWEDLYRGASPAQQAEWLRRARAQGILYAHRLQDDADGSTRPGSGAAPSILPSMLAGQVQDLLPLRAPEAAVTDPALDGRQREAVARALSTSDVCLIQGLPGSGKTRVVTEIVTQAAGRGERILFVAPTAAALDRVLEEVAGRPSVDALRCLGRGELPDHLPPCARALTVPERARLLREETLPQARQARDQSERRCERAAREQPAWPQLLDFADNRRRLEEQCAALKAQGEGVPDVVRREAARALGDEGPAEAGALARSLAACGRAHAEKRRDLQTARAKAEQQQAVRQREVAELTAKLDAVRPLAEARRQGRWWSPSWWRASLGGDVCARAEALQAEHVQAAAGLEELGRELATVDEQLRQAEAAFEDECRRLCAAEADRRRAEVADQEAAVRHELALLEAKWQQVCGRLGPDSPRPAAMTPEAVTAARAHWEAKRDRDEEARAFARQWLGYLEESAEDLPAQLARNANLVAAPLTDLPRDDGAGEAGTFDLLVVEEAEQVTDAELLQAARRARRWVLVGEPSPAAEGRPGGRGGSRPRPRPRAAAALHASCFQRLWDHLHCDPSRLPYAWVKEHDRLCCRLHPVPAEQRHRLESEWVADFPEIELRILTLPRATPVLAEVVFPPAMSIESAKEYIYRELQELPVQAAGRTACWLEQPEAVVLDLGDAAAADARAVALEAGAREIVTPGPSSPEDPSQARQPWRTCRLEFERAHGWQRERAEEWVYRHLRLRDLGRTVRLETLYRMDPALAAVLADLLWEGAAHVPEPAPGPSAPAVEFVAVPPVEPGRPRRERAEPAEPSRSASLPRAGAGLELDLSGPRRADRLPAEFRPLLPASGVVNYLEAQAVVRKLRELTADPALRAAAAAGPGNGRGPVVAVMALSAAQATLLRELVRRCDHVAGCGLAVEVDRPEAFRHRECLAALVSLTRSHSHRAVPLGEGPRQLPLALTRARARLVLFGDPGTLARRGQWQGALDHQGEADAAREGRLVAQLLRYLQGQGRHGRSFRLCPGDGP
jgi:hypothetical protein